MSRTPLVISAALHVFLLLLVIFGLPIFGRKETMTPTPIPIEIVNIAEVANTRKSDKPDPKPKPVAEPPKPASEKPKPKPEPVKAKSAPPKTPEPPKQTAQVAEKREPEALEKPDKKPEKKPDPPKDAKKQPPKKEEVKQSKPDISSILKNLQETKQASEDADKHQREEDSDTPKTQAIASAEPERAGAELSMTELDALRRQLVGCWNFPAGARDAENLIVDIIVEVNPDRTVKTVEIADVIRAQMDSFYRTAAESARRAVLKCQPLELPPDKYATWQNMTIQFDPRELL